MSDKNTRPLTHHSDISVVLADDDSQHAIIVGFRVEPTPDGLGLVIATPPGKTLDLTDGRFVVSGDKKRIEVRCK